MPDTPRRGGGKQLLGQPWWVWAAGAAALIGGYVYLRSKGKAAAAQPAAGTTATGTTSPTGLSWDQFLLFLHDQQGSTSSTTTTTTAGAPAPAPGGKTPKPARKTPQPPVMSNFYTVKPGDTLAGLAKKFGISRVQLAHANGLGTGAGLRTGTRLRVPGPVRPRPGGPG